MKTQIFILLKITSEVIEGHIIPQFWLEIKFFIRYMFSSKSNPIKNLHLLGYHICDTLFYEQIFMNVNIMKTFIYHLKKYDLSGHWR